MQLCSHRQGIALLRVTRNDMTVTALPVCALVQSCKSSEFCPALDLKRLHLQDMQCFQPYPSQPTSHVIPFSPKSIWSLSRSTSPLDCLFSAWFRTSKWSFSPIGIDPRHKIILTIKWFWISSVVIRNTWRDLVWEEKYYRRRLLVEPMSGHLCGGE